MGDRLIIFRPSVGTFAPFVAAARSLFPVTDVFDLNAISRLSADSSGGWAIELNGRPLSEEERVLYLGCPTPAVDQALTDHDRWYVAEEWRITLLAALTMRRRRYLAPGTDCYLLSEKPTQRYHLAELGWVVPDVSVTVDFGTDAIVRERSVEPAPQSKSFVVVTESGYYVHPDLPHGWEMARWLTSAVVRTQQFLRTRGWPWAVVPIAMTERGVHAFGLSWNLPPSLARHELVALASDIWTALETS